MLKGFVKILNSPNLRISSENLSGQSKWILRIPKKIGIEGYALLAIPVATFCLGTWQVQRRTWKLNLIKELERKSKELPIDFPENPEELSKLEYCKVRVRGTFVHSNETYIGPRSRIAGNDQESQHRSGLMSSCQGSGNLVITPFKLANRDLTILINRGWVPLNRTSPKSRQEGQIEEEVELVGTVRLNEQKPPFAPKHKYDSQFFHFRDIELIAKKSGASPYFLDASFESSAPGGPQGGQTRMLLRNEHFSYIITWYSLSVITSFLWYRRYMRVPALM